MKVYGNDRYTRYGLVLNGMICLFFVISATYNAYVVGGLGGWAACVGLEVLVLAFGTIFAAISSEIIRDRRNPEEMARSRLYKWGYPIIFLIVLIPLLTMGYRLTSYYLSLRAFRNGMTAYAQTGDKGKYKAVLSRQQVVEWEWWPLKLSPDDILDSLDIAFKRAEADGDLKMMREIDYEQQHYSSVRWWDRAIIKLRQRQRQRKGSDDGKAKATDESEPEQPRPAAPTTSSDPAPPAAEEPSDSAPPAAKDPPAAEKPADPDPPAPAEDETKDEPEPPAKPKPRKKEEPTPPPDEIW
ncbi:MAG: hypothetical protein ABII72_04175 [Parcubacteria group bacterium]